MRLTSKATALPVPRYSNCHGQISNFTKSRSETRVQDIESRTRCRGKDLHMDEEGLQDALDIVENPVCQRQLLYHCLLRDGPARHQGGQLNKSHTCCSC